MDALTLFCTASLIAGGLYWFVCVLGPAEQKGKSAVHLSGGSISADKVQDNYKQYWSFFRRPKEIEVTENVPAFVDTFYNLVTDIYEWGWGQSFHFSPSLPGKSDREATRVHEEMAVDLLKINPGSRILDAGCGVGGPMRAIASHSGAHVVGITINEYQVNRARTHNKKAKLDSQCEVVCGNFLEMPFENDSFDGAYSIEATCHAPKLEEVYSEIYRVLKPGSLYVSYEWVTTELYHGDNAEHVDIIQGIERGDALPGLRSYDQIAAIAKKVGFEVVKEKDLAKPPAKPWWTRLKMGRFAYGKNILRPNIFIILTIKKSGPNLLILTSTVCSIFSPKVGSSKADWSSIFFKCWRFSHSLIDLRNRPDEEVLDEVYASNGSKSAPDYSRPKRSKRSKRKRTV